MKKVFLLPAFLLIFLGCVSQPRIFTDIDTNYDTAEYKTYVIEGPQLEDSPSQLSVNPILLQRIERAIHLALEERGLSESPEPDMIVRFFMKIDNTDRKILELLQEDGRIAASHIADEMDISIPTVSERIKKLQESGIIQGFHAV